MYHFANILQGRVFSGFAHLVHVKVRGFQNAAFAPDHFFKVNFD